MWADEANFTRGDVQKKAFARKYQNLILRQIHKEHTVLRLVAAISKEYGVEHFEVFESNIDSKIFCRITTSVLKNGRKCAIFGDNASYHLSKFT